MDNSIHVYADCDVSKWHVSELNDSQITIYRNLEEFNQVSDSENKHAVLHACFPYRPNVEGSLDLSVLELLVNCTTVSVLVSEVHTPIVDFMHRFRQPQMRYIICGVVEGIQTYPWMDWFATTSTFYKTSNVLNQLTPYQPKPKYFDILLGQPKPHRDRVYHYIKNNKLDSQVIMTYLLDHWTKSIKAHGDDGFILDEPGLTVPNEEFNWTVTTVNYYGQAMSLSQVVPIQIYNETAYTVIAETNLENHYTFFTEKTCKPILAERLFIMLGGQYYLRNLRSLGFKTFDGIIDESYDLEPDNNQRWAMAIEQMKYLFKQPQAEILAKVKPIAEHNRRVMLETDWVGKLRDSLRNFITSNNRP
jgi:hypothetical protein